MRAALLIFFFEKMAERLHFNTGMAYESMLAAEHLARYWLLRDVCKGKRVLDVACGEGYGSSLLRRWGASSVVGVDISEDAIANAVEKFGVEGISYRLGDASKLAGTLADEEKFDLIACFETMEHVQDVLGLLRGLRDHLAPRGIIAISCPNDSEVMGDQPNEFHLRRYTFAEFQAATTAVLGGAEQWLLGTPVIGFGVCDLNDRWAQGMGSDLSNMLQGTDAVSSRFLPAQIGHEISAQKAHFYVGVWGDQLPRSLIAAPIAYRAYVGPWNSWVAAREENERLLAEQARQDERHAAAMAQQARELDAGRAQLPQRNQEIQQLESEIGAYKTQVASERSARLVMASKLHERNVQHQQLTENLRWLGQRAAELESAQRITDDMRRAADEALRAVTSRGYRAVQCYYRLYEHGATRWFMRPARRLAAAVRRVLK